LHALGLGAHALGSCSKAGGPARGGPPHPGHQGDFSTRDLPCAFWRGFAGDSVFPWPVPEAEMRGSCLEGRFWSIPSLPPGPAGRSADRCRDLLGVGGSCPPCALSWGQQRPLFSAQSLPVPELQGLPCLPRPARSECHGDRALLPDSGKAGVEPHLGPSTLDPACSLAVTGRCRAGAEDAVLMCARDPGWFYLPSRPLLPR